MRTAVHALSIFLFGAVASLAGELDWVEHRIGDLGVMTPVEGWEGGIQDSGELFARRLWRNADGEPEFMYFIIAEPHQIPAVFYDWLPVEVSTDYLRWEAENMQVEGVDKGEFELLELDIYEETHGNFTLHVLRNVKRYIEKFHPLLNLETQELYLVFLQDFPETTTFYKVFLNAVCFYEDCTTKDLDLLPMYPLLDDLRDYSIPEFAQLCDREWNKVAGDEEFNETLTTFLARGSPKMVCDGGRSLLFVARTVEEIKTLLASGVDPNLPTQDDVPPVFVAAAQGKPEIIRALINAGANPNFQHGITKETPLHIAVQNRQPEAVRVLLELGARTDLRDRQDPGLTPPERAARYQMDEITEIFKEAKGD